MPAGELVPEEVKWLVLSSVICSFCSQMRNKKKQQTVNALSSRNAMQTNNPSWTKAGQSCIMQDGCASWHFCGVTKQIKQ